METKRARLPTRRVLCNACEGGWKEEGARIARVPFLEGTHTCLLVRDEVRDRESALGVRKARRVWLTCATLISFFFYLFFSFLFYSFLSVGRRAHYLYFRKAIFLRAATYYRLRTQITLRNDLLSPCPRQGRQQRWRWTHLATGEIAMAAILGLAAVRERSLGESRPNRVSLRNQSLILVIGNENVWYIQS